MSRNLTDVGDNSVTEFCGPEGRRESYQITGPHGYVQFTWAEFRELAEAIKSAHGDREASPRERHVVVRSGDLVSPNWQRLRPPRASKAPCPPGFYCVHEPKCPGCV